MCSVPLTAIPTHGYLLLVVWLCSETHQGRISKIAWLLSLAVRVCRAAMFYRLIWEPLGTLTWFQVVMAVALIIDAASGVPSWLDSRICDNEAHTQGLQGLLCSTLEAGSGRLNRHQKAAGTGKLS